MTGTKGGPNVEWTRRTEVSVIQRTESLRAFANGAGLSSGATDISDDVPNYCRPWQFDWTEI